MDLSGTVLDLKGNVKASWAFVSSLAKGLLVSLVQ